MVTRKPVPVSGASRPRRHPVTTEPEYTDEEVAWLKALDRYKHLAGRPWPSWVEVLAIAHALGYRRCAPASPLPRFERGARGPGRKLRPCPAPPEKISKNLARGLDYDCVHARM